MARKLLVVGAHSADFVWRSAGTIAVTTSQGGEALVVALSYGERGESGELWKEQGQTVENVKRVRHEQAEQAAAAVGARFLCLDLGDYPLVVDGAGIERLIQVFRDEAPDVVLTHTAVDPFNPDHRVAFEAVQRILERLLQLAGTLEQPVFQVDIERRTAGGRGQRVTGIGVAVEKLDSAFRPGHEGLVDVAFREHGAHRHGAAGESFRGGDEVRGDAEAVGGEAVAAAAECRDDLVEDQENAVAVADLAQPLEVDVTFEAGPAVSVTPATPAGPGSDCEHPTSNSRAVESQAPCCSLRLDMAAC